MTACSSALGGGISTLGIIVVSFFYSGIHSDESLAEMVDVTHLRVEGIAIGVIILLIGLCIVVVDPVLSRKIR